MTATQIHTALGRVSQYGLACGYIEKHESGLNRVSLSRQDGCYHIKGFCGQTRIWDVSEKLTGARRKFDYWKNRIAQMKAESGV